MKCTICDNKKDFLLGIKDIKGKELYNGGKVFAIVEYPAIERGKEITGRIKYGTREARFFVQVGNNDCCSYYGLQQLKDFLLVR